MTWLFGPMFVKELLEMARQRRLYFVRSAVGAALLVMLAAVYAKLPAQTSLRDYAQLGQSAFEYWAVGQFAALCFFAVLAAAPLVAAEREHGSLELLFTTQLGSREILLGKLASRMLLLAFVALAALPVLVLIALFGGIDYNRLLKVAVVTASSVALFLAAGLYFSTRTKRPWVAVLLTFAFLAFVCGFVPFALAMILELGFRQAIGRPPDWFFQSLMLFGTWINVLIAAYPTGGMVFAYGSWTEMLARASVWLGVAGMFFVLACRRLRVEWRDRTTPRPFAGMRDGVARWLGRAFRTGGMPLGLNFLDRNPIVFRDRRARVYDPGGTVLTLQLLAWLPGIFLWAAAVFAFGSVFEPNATFLTLLQFGTAAFVHVVVALLAGSAIARERQRGSLDLLLLTRISRSELVGGTAFGVLRAALPAALFWILPNVVLSTGNYGAAESARALTGLYASFTLLVLASSLLVSIAAQRQSLAVVASLLLALALWYPYRDVYMGDARKFGDLAWLVAVGAFLTTTTLAAVACSPRAPNQRLICVAAFALLTPVVVPCFAAIMRDAPHPAGSNSATVCFSPLGFSELRRSGVGWAYRSILENLVAAGVLFAVAVFGFDRLAGRRDKDKPSKSAPNADSVANEPL